jgi:hypothetical protein
VASLWEASCPDVFLDGCRVKLEAGDQLIEEFTLGG